MAINIYKQIERLLQYGLNKELITKWDIEVVRNKLLEVLELDEFETVETVKEQAHTPVEIVEKIVDWAAENGRLKENTVTYRDLLDTKIMACFVPLPSEINRRFFECYEKEGAEASTKAFYQFSKDVHYIRTDRIGKNEQWLARTEYGDLEITINLSKPEKDPKAIAAAKNMKQSSYPKCLLCKENAGYAGRVNHPARQNHRIISVQLNDEQWFLQFSPYVYYNEHAIVFSAEHTPMKISKETFARLLQFVDQFSHYFLGSNADLPIVGGSILTHDHFQGGHHQFPMAKAEIEKEFTFKHYPNVRGGIVEWPMSVIRLQSSERDGLVKLSDYILQEWKTYSDADVEILAFTDETPHNTITPIARRRGELFELDLVLRNNRTNDDHPMGIFHPHEEVHHIKKENIGLIEVMGLAVLPGRLKEEMNLLAHCLVSDEFETEIEKHEDIIKHLEWARKVKAKHTELSDENVHEILKEEIGMVFAAILEHAGVFKRDDRGQQAFERFMNSIVNNYVECI
ncbi:UDP-glucose--hexose-1-phosphate uridylyltransferase [Priestia abyssalis]|uniref:UDP-glucose--hexose-1-phosphate uridylyltransferase n=1 Tax=Priestia abyssalis TaxID=1221450 RepID=UPI000994FF7D|nr:UDP-glucose--hexose-1-phosphate uridylyltransferase [Priestia abyssalis]